MARTLSQQILVPEVQHVFFSLSPAFFFVQKDQHLSTPIFDQENRRLREHVADSDQRCVTAVQLLQQDRPFLG